MASLCQLQDGVCVQCGQPRAAGVRFTCPSRKRFAHIPGTQIISEPGIIQKAATMSKAVARWVAAGSPGRSQQEIDEVLTICRACDKFTDEGRPRCKLCGCSVNNKPDGLRNKIAMATESCPMKPPKWTAAA